MRRPLLAAAALAAAALAAPAAADAATYRFAFIPGVAPVAVNASDVVVGNELSGDISFRKTFTWKAGVLSPPFGDLDGPFQTRKTITGVWDIADDGTVVGGAGGGVTPLATRAARWPYGSTVPEPLVGNQALGTRSLARGISADGALIVGDDNDGVTRVGLGFGASAPSGALTLYAVNAAGDIVGCRPDPSGCLGTLWRNGGAITLPFLIPAPADFGGYHPLGEDGSVIGVVYDAARRTNVGMLRRPDGTVVEVPEVGDPTAVEGGRIVGRSSQLGSAVPVTWKGGRVTNLLDAMPSPTLWKGVVPTDISTKGTIVGVGTYDGTVTGWILTFRVVISGSVAAPPLPGGAQAAPAARIVLTPLDGGGAPITVTPSTAGRYRAEVAPGRYRIALQGASGCATGQKPCTGARTVDAQDDTTISFRTDATSRLAAPLPRPDAILKARRGTVAIKIACRLVTRPCTGTATITRKQATLARLATLRIPAGATTTLRLPLTRAGKKALNATAKPIRTTLTLAIKNGKRTTPTTLPIRLDG